MNPPELSRSVVPPGGYVYEQPLCDGSYTRISGASYDHILELTLKYRQLNGMLLAPEVQATPEAVWSDYNAWVCSRYPWLCSPVRTQPQATIELTSGASGFELLLNRINRWLARLATGPIEWIDQRSALERANICLGCPQNVYWETNCGPCNQNAALSSAALRGARRLSVDSALRGCRAFGTLQEVAVWINHPGGDDKYQPPPFCWRL